jgi:quercetin dioxygenase-like cupin family protein
VQGNSGAIVVRAGSSRVWSSNSFLKGSTPTILKLSSKDTNGQLSTFWYKGKEKTGPSFHSHPFQDEVFYVINGSYLFKLGNELTELNTGDLIFLPRNIPHTWTQISEEGQLFYFLQPAGKMEEFFLEMTRTGGKLSKDQANIVSEAHGIVNHGPGINWQDKHETISVLTNGFVVRSAIDRKNNPSLLSGNSPNFLKVAGSDTLDQLSIFEYHGKSKGGPPLHKHPFQDETFYVLSGTYLFVCGQDQFTLNPGDMIFLPKDVPHTWAQTSDEGKPLVFISSLRVRWNNFLIPLAKEICPRAMMFFKDHDMEVTGPPIQY